MTALSRIAFYSGTIGQLVDEIGQHLSESTPFARLVTLNPEIWVDSFVTPEIAEAIQSARWVVADGVGITLARKVLGLPPIYRIPGSDLVVALLEQRRFRLAIVGATNEALVGAVAKIERDYAGSSVVFSRNGYFSQADWPFIAAQIKEAKPDIVLVGMGSPKQDAFISYLTPLMIYGVAIGVGGMIDVLGGKVNRSPRWMQQAGVEWVWRILLQPARIKRLLKWVPVFFYRLVAEMFQRRNLVE
ncbi:glycosyltransferase [bacterium]|nr:glycosyltransferase [bacterium]